MKLIKGIPMNRFPYKIFLDRYAQKDLSKPNIKQGVKGTVVVATTDKSDPKYPQKEICTLEEVLDEGYYRVKNIFDDSEEYKLHINDLTEPTELYPEQIWSRIADAMEYFELVQYKDINNKDGTYKAYYKLLENWKFVPAGRILASVGTEFQNKLTPFNCYVVPYPKDSRKGATDTLQTMIEIMSRGGGVGINLSSLRPRHAPVHGVNGTSSGAVSWGGGYSYYTGLIEQGGSRRGALMLGLAVWHPDILEFIDSKTQAGKIENANISVFITDDFMKAVEKDEIWKLEFPDTSFVNYDDEWDGDLNHWKLKGYPVKTYKVLPARELWNKIITSAWKSAEPGIVWMDRYNKLSNTWYYEDIIGVNPCGEQGLPAYGVCNLGHINLSRILLDPNQHYGINWEDLRNTIHQAIRFMDNIIDMAFYFLPDNEKVQKQSRRVGLGTMGLAELMIKLGIKYGSKTSLDFIDALYSFIRNEAYLASSLLAKERGSFPAFDTEKYLKGKFIEQLPEEIKACIRKHGIRNSTLLTQAPTGTVGTMIETSTGIEPFFQWKYLRKCRLGNDIRYEPVALRYMFEHNLKDESELPSYFVTAMELTPKEHIKVMASVQRYVDSSISKTVNCPADWSIEQVNELYKMAYNLGCKGITIYRDGSRDTQVLNRIEDNSESSSGSKDNPESLPDPLEAELPEFKWGDSLPVPEDTVYKKVKLNTGCGKIILMVGWSESLNKVIDVYTIVNSTGGCQLNIQGLAITISQYLRLGGNINKLLEKSKEAGNCGSYQFKRGQGQKDLCGKSCFNGIVKTIAEFKPQGSPSLVQNLSEENLNSVEYEQKGIEQTLLECPSCKRHTLRKTEGCYSCTYCGYSKCE